MAFSTATLLSELRINAVPLLYRIYGCAVRMEEVDSTPPAQVGLLPDGSRRENDAWRYRMGTRQFKRLFSLVIIRNVSL